MRIGFDAKRIFNNSTGLGNYGRTLLKNLSIYFPENQYVLFTPTIDEKKNFQNFASEYSTIQSNPYFQGLWRSFGIKKDLEKQNIEIFHGLSNEIPLGLKKIKKIVTIHDLIFKVLPHTYPYFDRLVFDKKTKYACENADTIIAISENTKSDIIRFYDIEPTKIKVIYQPCDPIFYQSEKETNIQLDLPPYFILYVGAITKRKNLLTLVKAIHILPKDLQIPLIVVGKGNQYQKEVQLWASQHKLEKKIIWLENVQSTYELKYLYENCTMLVYPSLYEGFGLPVVEAFLCETPVITSDTSSLAEIGGDLCYQVPPTDVEALSKAISFFLTNPDKRAIMGYECREYALQNFDPMKLTRQMMDEYLE